MPRGRHRLVNEQEISSMLDDDDDDGIGPMPIELSHECLESDSDTDPGEEIVEEIPNSPQGSRPSSPVTITPPPSPDMFRDHYKEDEEYYSRLPNLFGSEEREPRGEPEKNPRRMGDRRSGGDVECSRDAANQHAGGHRAEQNPGDVTMMTVTMMTVTMITLTMTLTMTMTRSPTLSGAGAGAGNFKNVRLRQPWF